MVPVLRLGVELWLVRTQVTDKHCEVTIELGDEEMMMVQEQEQKAEFEYKPAFLYSDLFILILMQIVT
jgi:hypothetical protein